MDSVALWLHPVAIEATLGVSPCPRSKISLVDRWLPQPPGSLAGGVLAVRSLQSSQTMNIPTFKVGDRIKWAVHGRSCVGHVHEDKLREGYVWASEDCQYRVYPMWLNILEDAVQPFPHPWYVRLYRRMVSKDTEATVALMAFILAVVLLVGSFECWRFHIWRLEHPTTPAWVYIFHSR